MGMPVCSLYCLQQEFLELVKERDTNANHLLPELDQLRYSCQKQCIRLFNLNSCQYLH